MCVASSGILSKGLLFRRELAANTHSFNDNHIMASLVNGSFASPLADANLRIVTEGGWLAKVYNGMSGLNVLISFLLVLVAYDQGESYDANGCGVRLLMWELVMYVWNKGSIVGPAWKMPFIGPFLSSVNPKMDEYKAKWASGELSCVSVFHKYGWHAMETVEGVS